MAQKILVAHADEGSPPRDRLRLGVDQVVLARAPMRTFGQAIAFGLKKSSTELTVAYDGCCIWDAKQERASLVEMLGHGVLVARAGVGFPAPVHLERFASPARLCITDEPRLAGVGGIGMLTWVLPEESIAQAIVEGSVLLPSPVTVHVVLTGKLRPFVCARDVALECLRRGLSDVVRAVAQSRSAPVVVEFSGPGARALSVPERSVLAAVAPQLGAAAALFPSDERTEVFLRDQRRSKAHRTLSSDAGALCEELMQLDLAAVDPLLQDADGVVRAVRDLAGQPVTQVLLGGDSGITLRDLLAAAMLLKSKRVSSHLDFLLSVPSRQMLEVLAASGALTDLIATGARLVEPDARVVAGELFPPSHVGATLRTCEPVTSGASGTGGTRRASATGVGGVAIASAETLAFAVATGQIGDPRAFRRPVRVTVPRFLPTDDVLIARKPERAALQVAVSNAHVGAGRGAELARVTRAARSVATAARAARS